MPLVQSHRTTRPNSSVRLQLECSPIQDATIQACFLCNQPFELREARVMVVCDHRGDSYGELCPRCLSEGSGWIWSQLPRRIDARRRAQNLMLSHV
jgi:hypothetical protein